MNEKIVEFKLDIGPIKINLDTLINKIFKENRIDPATKTALRFLKLFQEHDVTPSQVQRFIPKLTPDKLKSVDSLLPELTSDVLESASKIFGVQLSWLEGASDRIYAPLFCYKHPHLFFEEYYSFKKPDKGFAIRALSTTKKLDYKADVYQPLALVFVEKIQDINDVEILRYRVFTDEWDWSHPPCRIQLKAMARQAYNMKRARGSSLLLTFLVENRDRFIS